ncbi:exonuclease SbcCD subunit D [Paraconexibacter antarcticus]|uniref:Nuclease SbcCD subunit D n=1 Tax=Paraconexibacter antarcticus TaxID=2949664 RepID=A0ABY5DQL2_9ACTN|nr:exonuclease SbcCD subunit D [Paraconexibacter antarcticus]UTI63367.1 exonuclease SbcCD subunit D [Paraconexibacter antarcticus]
MAVIFHTSDWHVGKSLARLSREEDHRAVLAEIVTQARQVKPDLIIHSGDVFDSFRPATADMRLALSTLNSLGRIAPTVVLAGNHDSPSLLEVFSLLMGEHAPVQFVPRAKHPDRGGILDFPSRDGSQRLRLAPMPFVHANRQVDWFDDPRRFMGKYAEQLQVMNQLLHQGLEAGYDPVRDVLLYAAHLHVSGAHLSGTERPLHVSDTYAAEAGSLPTVSYTALGHIHKPQQLPGRPACYVGSPMQLDFGEAGQEKSSIMVVAEPGRPADITRLPLNSARPLRVLHGTIEEITAAAPDVDRELVRVIVQTQDPIPDLADTIVGLLPNATLVEVVEDVASRRLQVLDPDALDPDEPEPTYEQLLTTYLEERATRDSDVPALQVQTLFAAMRHETEEGEDPPIDGLRNLLDAELPRPPSRVVRT